jgi:sulfopyruvate decarboxylase subunit beta
MKRYDCLKAIAPHITEELVVTNLGAVRHEWQALRPHPGNYHLQNLGLTSSVALGLALALPHRKVVAFDGDGSLLLNLGSLATIANQHPNNLIHIVLRQRMLRVLARRADGDGGAGRSCRDCSGRWFYQRHER